MGDLELDVRPHRTIAAADGRFLNNELAGRTGVPFFMYESRPALEWYGFPFAAAVTDKRGVTREYAYGRRGVMTGWRRVGDNPRRVFDRTLEVDANGLATKVLPATWPTWPSPMHEREYDSRGVTVHGAQGVGGGRASRPVPRALLRGGGGRGNIHGRGGGATMTHPLAGKRPDPETLVRREALEVAYRSPAEPLGPIKNGTSGHRGRTGSGFSDRHVAAMTQALADIRAERGTFGPAESDDPVVNLRGRFPGPVVLGKDVRYTSDFAQVTAAEVFAGNGVPVVVHRGGRATPTPVVSHTILAANAGGGHVEGAILTASHNPPDDAGYKTNGLDGGPNTRTRPIDERANRLLADPSPIRRLDYGKAVRDGLVVEGDLVGPYVRDLAEVIDFEPIRGVRFAATPLGGSAVGYYEAVAAMHDLDLQVVVGDPDPASANRTFDWDGRLRGDPSSPFAMRAVEGLRESLGVPFLGANDNDADRFGGEDAGGVLAPNHVLCVLFDYLCRQRNFPAAMGVGRTIGTTHLLDRIAHSHGRPVHEVDVGFKWYVRGLIEGRYVLAGEESAGLSVPRRDGRPWVTEKDGIAAVLLVMEVVARTRKDVSTLYRELEGRFGVHRYERVDSPASAERKRWLAELSADRSEVERRLGGKRIAGRSVERLVVGDGVKVVLDGGVWVLKRASGTEDIIKDYREERGEGLETARRASEEIDRLLFG